MYTNTQGSEGNFTFNLPSKERESDRQSGGDKKFLNLVF